MDENHAKSFDGVSLSLARGASLVMMGYFVIKIGGLTLDNGWKYVFSGYGLLWLLEMALVIMAKQLAGAPTHNGQPPLHIPFAIRSKSEQLSV